MLGGDSSVEENKARKKGWEYQHMHVCVCYRRQSITAIFKRHLVFTMKKTSEQRFEEVQAKQISGESVFQKEGIVKARDPETGADLIC